MSSSQPHDLGPLIAAYQPEHVVVKLGLPIENAAARDASAPQIQSALKAGCSVAGYLWLYASADPARSVRDALGVWKSATDGQHDLPMLWVDWEPYTDGTCPTPGQVLDALHAAELVGQRCGVYTGRWVWQAHGDPTFAATLGARPLWDAAYDGVDQLEPFSPYGGWTARAGHQWTSKPVDQSVFDAAALGLGATR